MTPDELRQQARLRYEYLHDGRYEEYWKLHEKNNEDTVENLRKYLERTKRFFRRK